MEGYLRGYYGYKNFGDELLFFGVVKRLFDKYPLTKLFVEVGNKSWMEDRVRENYQGLITEKQLGAIKFVSAKQHSHKIITHLINLLGLGKYKKTFKFFGGGEVLSDERPFPHDGWNIPILFNYSVRKGQFILLGGIGKSKRGRTDILYRQLLPKAEKIVVRDRDSLTIAKKFNEESILHQDFAQETILRDQGSGIRDQGSGIRDQGSGIRDQGSGIRDQGSGIRDQGSGNREQGPGNREQGSVPYILININKQSVDRYNIDKIVQFCQNYPDHKKIFFPCDINDDKYCFLMIKKHISDLEMYDWTKHSLQESLSLFYHADGGIGARLHFLLPLKLYNKPLMAIPYADKINKLIF